MMYHNISSQGLQLIKLCESFRSKVYICPAGLLTIGFGHVVRRGKNFVEISMQEAENLLLNDIVHFEHMVRKLIIAPIGQNQFDALVSFTFNVGAASLQRSTLRQKINRLEFDDASREFFRWIYAGGIKLKGLIRRRKLEAELFCSGL